jgi:hypothetical protein
MNSWTQKKGGTKSDDPMEKLNNESCKLLVHFIVFHNEKSYMDNPEP